MIESMEMEDVIADLIDRQLNPMSAKGALLNMGFGACEELYAPASAAHLVLVYGNSDYAFTSYDLGWLEKAGTVLSYQAGEDINIFFIEMESDIEEYYIDAAAVIKIFNVAFPVKNFFVFRVSENIAFGIARDLDRQIPNNFAISGLIRRDNMDAYEELLFEIPSSEIFELPDIVINNSPQEKDNERNYDGRTYDADYLSFLSEFESFYGVDTSRERAKFWAEFQGNSGAIGTYKSACVELSDVVGNAAVSSYDDLDTAQLAEEKTRQIQIPDLDNGNSELPNNESLGFSEEAFEDAEQMLKEMLQKGN